MPRLTTITIATTENSITTEALDGIRAAIAQGKGWPLKLDPTAVTGNGSEQSTTITMPDSEDFSFVVNRKYNVSGVFIVRNGSTVICTRVIRDAIVFFNSGGFLSSVRSGETLVGDKHATFSSFFTSDNNVPGLGSINASLLAVYTAVNASGFVVEFDGTIADYGTN